jgi:hypothetical protein
MSDNGQLCNGLASPGFYPYPTRIPFDRIDRRFIDVGVGEKHSVLLTGWYCYTSQC